MEIGRVVGTVVSTIKSSGLNSYKLLVVAPVEVATDAATPEGATTYVAIDLVGTGEDEIVLVTRGSAARIPDASNVPTDAAIIAVVDTVQIGSKNVYSKA
ncbi:MULTISPECIES: EutN/CcmL family microcompartment protein [Bradyrhizobium]|uniref:EutN/CcmL family microcompartment protein n=1 Tax=Bradyrhizobium brasilense TaxID=1419277 RepID=A0ABY8J9V2_9BRAD|nr:EutN/CcmL family microcompartment protein [Bradyrhizobium brasilense]WFU61245.1 EutN/CcmL family microcompartment protein [Bradyrhizobium brasilense]